MSKSELVDTALTIGVGLAVAALIVMEIRITLLVRKQHRADVEAQKKPSRRRRLK